MLSAEAATRIDIEPVAARARDFLLAGQDARGAWRDFFLPAGESDGWVTAYVALALAKAGDPEGWAAALRGWSHLEAAVKPEGGWGYNAATPVDADSTLWALRLAEALGVTASDAARRGLAVLETHRRRDGGLATYASPAGPRGYVGLPASVDFSAWALPHACVSAAAAALSGMRDDPLATWLGAMQAEDGHWPSYWWFDPGYATAEAVEALPPGAARDRAARFAEARLQVLAMMAPPPAFALSHVVRVLAVARSSMLETAVALLAATQAENGSWPASARLRVPAPDCVTPSDAAAWTPWHGLRALPMTLEAVLAATFQITSLDHRRAFTTATALRALTAASAASRP
ncbi:hypothetical protein S2M10_29990 [Sphingomonas sp. S2M10]|nr:hypothetical protein [Sphingomonas sp. S2M10]